MEVAQLRLPPYANLALEGEILHTLWQNALTALQSLQTPLGVAASGQNDHFHAIFGRDSLWTVLLALEAGRLQPKIEMSGEGGHSSSSSYQDWLHELSATVLRGLASLQGKVVNDVNEEQPGRIVHEYWDPVPQRMIAAQWPVANGNGCYYGAFDATFLYLTTIAQVDDVFHDQGLLEELWPHAELALQWMLAWSDLDQDGLVEYQKRNPQGIGLGNQVWKDSGESVQTREHVSLKHPLAWVEVQGYAWRAYASYIELARKLHCLDTSLEQAIRQHMDSLRTGLERFWLAGEQYPAIVLDGAKNTIDVVSSNPGHLLWSGCLDQTQAQLIYKRLVQPDMLTPWGVRTLSERAYYYNPLSYHCGAVWPFDNAVIAIGLQRHNFHLEAQQIATAILNALLAFEDPVELYTVQPARWLRSHRIDQEWFLADYFRSSAVQAWTAAAILYLTAMLM